MKFAMKKKNRIIISIALAVALLMTVMLTTASGKTMFPLPDDPTPAQIKATYYLNSEEFAPYVYGTYEAPYKEYLEEMMLDDGFDAGLISWELLNLVTEPINSLEAMAQGDILGEKGYYEVILFDMFYEAQRNDSFVGDLDSMVNSSVVSASGDLKATLGNMAFEYPTETGTLTPDEIDRIANAYYEQGGSYYVDVFGSLSNFKKVVGTVNDIDAMATRVGTLLAFQEIADSRIDVLNAMYEECSEEQLKKALEDVIAYYENDFSVEYIIGQEIYDYGIERLLDKANSYLWEDIITELGGGWLKFLTSVGKAASNSWLSTDEYYESFYEMNSLRNIERLVDTVSGKAKEQYKNNPSEKNAAFVNSCVEVSMNVYELGMEYSADYLSMLDDMGINHVAIALGYPGLDHSDLIDKFKTQRVDMDVG